MAKKELLKKSTYLKKQSKIYSLLVYTTLYGINKLELKFEDKALIKTTYRNIK